jgi:lysylphosphatidylglycerol synthetase-like protein (DUF2156 family)
MPGGKLLARVEHQYAGRMMCDALHETDTGDGVIFLTDKSGAAPYRSAALMSHKHACCEVISVLTFPAGVNVSAAWILAAQSFARPSWRRAFRRQQLVASAAKNPPSSCLTICIRIKRWY